MDAPEFRPVKASRGGDVVRIGGLEVRPDEGLVLANGEAIVLSVHEFRLLVALAMRAGRVMTRQELYAVVWNRPLRSGDRTIDVYVHKLRAKLDGALPGWQHIHTHVGFGYRLSPICSHGVHGDASGT
jgi:DNA-binding response OmpR family regulator